MWKGNLEGAGEHELRRHMVNQGDMRRMWERYAWVAVVLAAGLVVFVGCTVAPAPTVAPTWTPAPTYTPVPTETPAPTPRLVEVSRPPTRNPNATPVPDQDVEEGRLVRLTHTWDSEKDPDWSPDGTRIAFECFKDDDYESLGKVTNRPISEVYYPGDICVMNADGSGFERLTGDEGDDADPAWSPDGREIAFTSYRDRTWSIYVMNADGSGVRRVTFGKNDEGPTWSPDGTRLAFSSLRDGRYDIYAMNTDGSDIVQITDTVENEFEPDWSPDGSKIAFSARLPGSGSYDIHVANIDGTDITVLRGSDVNERAPTWSPDGRTIAYEAATRKGLWAGVYELFVVNGDGTRGARLTHRHARSAGPAWSPDGSKLIFSSDLVRNSEIYIMDVDFDAAFEPPSLQRFPKQLTDSSYNAEPAWSPDGGRIAFVSDRRGHRGLYVMNVDGSETRRLTNYPHNDVSQPTWSPDGKRIAYVSWLDGFGTNIFVISDDGTGMTNLTSFHGISTPADEGMGPSWSPDGEHIAFISNPRGRYQIHIMKSDGTEMTRLDNRICPDPWTEYGSKGHRVPHRSLAWSPDGTRIAFTCGDSYLYLVDPSGLNQTSLYACDDPIASPTWSPDNMLVAFACGLSVNSYYLYMINIVDGEVTRITDERPDDIQPYDLNPSWSPDGSEIAFTSHIDGGIDIFVIGVAP